MKITQINNTNNFQGLYKIERKYIGDNTEKFFENNPETIISHKAWEEDIFVLTSGNKDKQFEESIKKDFGKYWKSKPLSNLMMYSKLLEEIYRINYVSNDYKEDWADYTDKWEQTTKDEDDIPF